MYLITHTYKGNNVVKQIFVSSKQKAEKYVSGYLTQTGTPDDRFTISYVEYVDVPE